ncbi:alpha-galactosidase [Lapillicoccus jejuensis]|uniref:Alpha-galactosidase n=1 Tax=Lapillicoccus jejuensis TaxID=402171 RepID=A0A542E435_9MICO|nr:alpha-galactosidase [Lapillicoccus jejuensis]TQJ10024.1 alpha-galactosidase [Lapillicoccus jejuensis]
MPATTAGPTVHLRAAGVSVLLEATEGRLPAMVHWGPELPGLDEESAGALVAASVPMVGPNNVDVPLRVAVVPEHWTGWSGRPGLRASRDGRSWSARLRVTSLEVDGTPVTGWYDGGPGTLVVRATDADAAIDLELVLELLPSGVLRQRATLTNTGEPGLTVDDLCVTYRIPTEATELLDFSGRWGRERLPQRTDLVSGMHLRENRRGRTANDGATLLHAGTPGFGFAAGDVWAVHTAWSGNHTHYAERAFTGESVLGGGELLLSGEVRLGTGASYAGPWVYGAFGHGLDDVARRFHRVQRSRERRVDTARPVTLNVWEAVYFDHDLPRLLDLAERAAALGVERFVLDDGWFGSRRDDHSGLGDWVVSQDVWPDGLAPLIDRVVELGMEFGLWFEPEMVNPDSDVARAHPEWVMSARPEWPVESRHQQVLDLAVPEAYAHVRDQMDAILTEYDIAYVKWDHNRDLVEAGNQLDGGRAAVHEQTLAFYRLLEELRAGHPGLEIESCSSGGARVDLGVLERTDRVWVSDNIDPHDRQHMMRWTTQLLPPEYLGSHIASGRSHTTGRIHDLNFRAATAVFGHLGIEWDLASATEAELAELRPWLDFYKAHRDLLLDGEVVRMDTADDRVLVHGVVAHDASRAVFAQVVLDSPRHQPVTRITFRGLDPERRYRVRPVLPGGAPSGLRPAAWWGEAEGDGASYAGVVVTGAGLALVGLASPSLHPDQAVLYTAEAV